ncbi:MAG: ASKHA domain-containing protein [Caldilineaceae bacterium]
MANVTIIYGEKQQTLEVAPGTLVGEAVVTTGLPLEQPCAGKGTCGKCKVLLEGGASPPDEVERANLTAGELAVGNRLACRAQLVNDAQVTLAPIVVYSNKIFRASNRHRRDKNVPLGLAIDLGSTTVAAFLTMLDNGEVVAGGGGLNQQTVYGADIISRLAAARNNPPHAERLHKLALASINQAVDSLKLPAKILQRVERVTIVCNPAMHHLLSQFPVETLAVKPFQPYHKTLLRDGSRITGGIFPPHTEVLLPPLIGGFVGSDALACLAYFGFDRTTAPIAAVDLGTNGEVMVTDGKRIVTGSTAAGPAFEGVNISCGSRAVDGAITETRIEGDDFVFETIADAPPVGLTGSGLLSLVHQLVQAGVIDTSGLIVRDPARLASRIYTHPKGARYVRLNNDGRLNLKQWDVRELQKAKAAIRATLDLLLMQLGLHSSDLEKLYLTGSFGGQLKVDAVLGVGMLPPVRPGVVQPVANGAGLGAALFLSKEGLARGEQLAAQAEQIDLEKLPEFSEHYVNMMALDPLGFSE